MPRARANMFTIFNVMEKKGYFSSNPANPGSQSEDGLGLYTGPVEYPKMLYHPEGLERVIVPGELILTPGGREKLVGEQRELVWRVVNDKKEEEEFRSLGWHLNARDSILAGGREAPPPSVAQVVEDKDARIRELERKLAEAQSVHPFSEPELPVEIKDLPKPKGLASLRSQSAAEVE